MYQIRVASGRVAWFEEGIQYGTLVAGIYPVLLFSGWEWTEFTEQFDDGCVGRAMIAIVPDGMTMPRMVIQTVEPWDIRKFNELE